MRVVVVGAGIMGLSTAWALTRRGHRVTLIEQSDSIPNPLAASGDQHRMIRRAYGSKSGYAALITEAYDAWEEMWSDLRASHYAPTGILCICQTEGDEADEFRQGFDAAGTPYERMSPEEAAGRFRFLEASTFRYAFFTPEGGVLLSRHIAADLVRWLANNGTEVRTKARVTSLDAERATVCLASGETIEADLVITTVGAWTLQLLPELGRNLRVYRTTVVYLDPPSDLRNDWDKAPAILSIGGLSEGFADIAEYRVLDVMTCAYTVTDDERFFAQRVGRVLTVSACSGHGYKFGASIGRRVADAAEGRDGGVLARWLRAELIAV